MFDRKKKIELSYREFIIMLYSLDDFRNSLLKENKSEELVNEIIAKLKNKMKVDKYDLGIMINSLNTRRNAMIQENLDISETDELLSKLLEIYKEFK